MNAHTGHIGSSGPCRDHPSKTFLQILTTRSMCSPDSAVVAACKGVIQDIPWTGGDHAAAAAGIGRHRPISTATHTCRCTVPGNPVATEGAVRAFCHVPTKGKIETRWDHCKDNTAMQACVNSWQEAQLWFIVSVHSGHQHWVLFQD
jgi:hypothetical protein